MSIGSGILLFVVGAILAFAIEGRPDWIDLDLVGYLLMGAGVVTVIIGLVLLAVRGRSARIARVGQDPVTGERVQREEVVHHQDGEVRL